MVGPGDVDDDLEPETAEECGKYGKVVKCIIFEVMYLLLLFLVAPYQERSDLTDHYGVRPFG